MDEGTRRRLLEALAFALERHGGQPRKGKPNVPYASHLLQVCGLALEYGEGDATLAQAALLHDVMEDCDVAEAELAERFGAGVARIVADCTDLLEGDSAASKGPWRERKERYVAHLRDAPRATRLVSACDKLHNLSNIVADLRAEGPGFLERFNASPPEILWYYQAVADALGTDLPTPLRLTYQAELAALEHLAGEAGDVP